DLADVGALRGSVNANQGPVPALGPVRPCTAILCNLLSRGYEGVPAHDPQSHVLRGRARRRRAFRRSQRWRRPGLLTAAAVAPAAAERQRTLVRRCAFVAFGHRAALGRAEPTMAALQRV